MVPASPTVEHTGLSKVYPKSSHGPQIIFDVTNVVTVKKKLMKHHGR